MPHCLVLFQKAGFDLDQAQELLSARGLSVQREAQRLLLSWAGGPQLSLRFAEGNDVLQEAQHIAVQTPYQEALSRCERKFEISFEDLEEVLDETNTLIEVQATLQEATDGYLFNSWNGEILPPESST